LRISGFPIAGATHPAAESFPDKADNQVGEGLMIPVRQEHAGICRSRKCLPFVTTALVPTNVFD
jgi:hypothetical protein